MSRPNPIFCPLLLCLLVVVSGCRPAVPPERDLLIATASVGGTFYPVGVALANLIHLESDPENPFLASAITSSGSAENIRMIQLGEAQLAIIQGLFGVMAHAGTDFYEGRPIRELRAVTVLWPNVEQVVVRRRGEPARSVREGLEPLQGDLLSLGPRWSGTEVSGKALLRALDWNPDADFRYAPMGFGPSADALQDRRIEGIFIGGGVPTAAITRILATLGTDEVQMLPFSDQEVEQIRTRYPVWTRYTIPAGSYPGQEESIPVIAQPNLLITSVDQDEQVIYEVTRLLWENLEFLHRQHPAAKSILLERAIVDLPLPLHPGAARYYREIGLLEAESGEGSP